MDTPEHGATRETALPTLADSHSKTIQDETLNKS
jgi:hypothetical protein